ncbi:MAG: adenylate/guanylate cyclase domain-containing protein [Pseudomonadales bacterium]
MWEEKEQDAFIRLSRYLFFSAGLAYVGHYHFYDKPMGLEPINQWFQFRMVVAAACFSAFLFYLSPLARTSLSKAPAILAIWLLCYTQAMITTWWDGTPWLFSFLYVTGAMVMLRLSPLNSLLLATSIMVTQTPFLLESGVPPASLISAAFVVLLITLFLRSSHVADVRNFVLNQENIAAQKRIIELNIEFSDRLRAFIPRIIAERLEAQVQQNHLSMIQATVEILRPRQARVACLFSDIRGYTAGSKDLDRFIDKSVLPEIKACSNAVEQFSGIPRKIGDLIFAYFDDPDITSNVVRCLLAGIEMARLNRDLNATINESEIRRYILISTGDAIVGNLGGLDSSIEITALGPPVNLLSRLDELSKNPRIASLLSSGDILICSSTLSTLLDANISLELDEINLMSLHLQVRDFPEVTSIFRIKDSTANHQRLVSFYRSSQAASSEQLDQNDIRLAG